MHSRQSCIRTRTRRPFANFLRPLLAAALLFGCGSDEDTANAADNNKSPETSRTIPNNCPASTAEPRRIGKVDSVELQELSGVVAGWSSPDVLWTHNDSGDSASLYGLAGENSDSPARHFATFSLRNIEARDIEDIAIGPGPIPGKPYLYLGDIGDNSQKRSRIRIYRLPEPTLTTRTTKTIRTVATDSLILVYPDRPHNAETLLVDPLTGDIFIVTKSSTEDAFLFRAPAPHDPNIPITLEALGPLGFGSRPELENTGLVTGGDINSNGDAILLRTYGNAYFWPRSLGVDLATALNTTPCTVPLRFEPQGEAIGFTTEGNAYYTLSEQVAIVWRFDLEK